MDDYIFPFDTCEIPNKKGIAQPFSVFFNLLICLLIFYFLWNSKTNHAKILLISILVFELFHTFSHFIHIHGNIQINITHFLAYVMNISFLYFFYKVTDIFPNKYFLFWLLLLVLLDLYLVFKSSFVYYLMSMSVIYISILFFYYKYLPKQVQNYIFYIISVIILIISLFFNEKINCKKMLKTIHFPFHIIIEITGLILFYIICSTFYKL
jgi:hypothetical protein